MAVGRGYAEQLDKLQKDLAIIWEEGLSANEYLLT